MYKDTFAEVVRDEDGGQKPRCCVDSGTKVPIYVVDTQLCMDKTMASYF